MNIFQEVKKRCGRGKLQKYEIFVSEETCVRSEFEKPHQQMNIREGIYVSTFGKGILGRCVQHSFFLLMKLAGADQLKRC